MASFVYRKCLHFDLLSQFKSSSNWWKFEDIWGKFTKNMFVAKLNHRAFDGQVC